MALQAEEDAAYAREAQQREVEGAPSSAILRHPAPPQEAALGGGAAWGGGGGGGGGGGEAAATSEQQRRVEAQLQRLQEMGFAPAEARPHCDGVTDVELLVEAIILARGSQKARSKVCALQ